MSKKRVITLILAASMCFGLSACGSKEDATLSGVSGGGTPQTAYKQEATTEAARDLTWGRYTFTIPGGFYFKGGSVMDGNDTGAFSVKKTELTGFSFSTEHDEETMMNAYNGNKAAYTSGQKEVSGEYGGIKWTGFQYDSSGTPALELYTTIDGVYIRVVSAGFAFDSEEAKEVLGSLRVSSE